MAVIWDGVDLALGKSLMDALPQDAQTLTYITGEQPNARGAEAMGMLPRQGGMDTSAMFASARDGNLAVLSILGANPMLHYPDAQLVREALEKVPFLVVSDLFMTDTAQCATLVLPAKGAFEKSGTTTNLAGDVLPLNAAKSLESPESALTDLEILIGLAEQLGVDLPTAEDLDRTIITRLANAEEPFTFGDERYARLAADAQPAEGLRVVLQTRIFAGGGTSVHDDRLAELRPLPEAAISAEDAAELGLKTGDYIDLECGGRIIHDLLVEIRAAMPRGAVALIDGLPDDPANCFAEGASVRVSNIRRLDRLGDASILQHDTAGATS
jgi:predicted molibdopterin-dependent oxidoreductase YjgC